MTTTMNIDSTKPLIKRSQSDPLGRLGSGGFDATLGALLHSLALFLNGVIGHALFVGLPLAFFAQRAAE